MNKKNNTNSIKGSLIMGFVWLLIWFAAAFAIGSDLILPGPVKTIQALAKLICTSGFWLDVLFTLFRVFAGAVISLAAGFVCAALASGNKAVREFLRLPVSFFKSIPVMAIIIYVILVVKADWVAIVVCILMCFPIAYTNMLSGMTAEVVIRIEGTEDVLIVPTDAVHRTSAIYYVNTEYDASTDTYGGMKTIETGISNDDFTAVTSGLELGDVVYYTERETGFFFGFPGAGGSYGGPGNYRR